MYQLVFSVQVDELAAEMGISGCMDARVGGNLFKGISGGQMKRLSVALSLISNPYILLLDEPTSGLDSAATMGVMGHIQSLTKQGMLLQIIQLAQLLIHIGTQSLSLL